MSSRYKRNRGEMIILSCEQCGRNFTYRRSEQIYYEKRGWNPPKRCFECRMAIKKRKAQETEDARQEQYQQERVEKRRIELQQFEETLRFWSVIAYNHIEIDSKETLYVLGNGFDLMHGVKSSYYSFRDSMGKNNAVRGILECYFTVEDIWAGFEENLAYFNLDMMCGSRMLDEHLDIADAYDDDAGMAEFYMAVENAIEPLRVVVEELPKQFRGWVETLVIGTDDRPLKSLFGNSQGKVLSFNYTEFAEELYGVSKSDVCYIHGCRRKEKGKPKDRLILGHLPGESDDAYNIRKKKVWKRNPLRARLVEYAQEVAVDFASRYEEDLTKNSKDIIQRHNAFWDTITDVKSVVTIGHSLAPVDWDYFCKIKDSIQDIDNVRWFIGCHSIYDLENLEALLRYMDIPKERVSIFRTDKISVALKDKNEGSKQQQKNNSAKERTIGESSDGKWRALASGNILQLIEQSTSNTACEVVMSLRPAVAVFMPDSEYLLIITLVPEQVITVFRYCNKKWYLMNELVGGEYQNILNRRLRRVYYAGDKLIFIYNNRVRRYSLVSGKLEQNEQIRQAYLLEFEGQDVSSLFRAFMK